MPYGPHSTFWKEEEAKREVSCVDRPQSLVCPFLLHFIRLPAPIPTKLDFLLHGVSG
jgi:hypothetical protein